MDVLTVGQLESFDKDILKNNHAFGKNRIASLSTIPKLAKSYLEKQAAVEAESSNSNVSSDFNVPERGRPDYSESELTVFWLLTNKPEIDDTGISSLTGAGKSTIKRLRKRKVPLGRLIRPDIDDSRLEEEIAGSKRRKAAMAARMRSQQDVQISELLKYNPYDDK